MSYAEAMTTLEVSIPDDLAQEASANLGDLSGLVAAFLREELARRRYEAWRKDRYSPEVEEVVRQSQKLADEMQRNGVTREGAGEEFLQVRQEILDELK